MKILYLTHHWYNNSHHSQYSGFQRLAVYAAKYHEVTVITWGDENKIFYDNDNIKTIIIKPFFKNSFLIRYIISLKGRSISNEYDVIHSLYSDCAYFLKKNTYIVTFHILPKIIQNNTLKGKIFIWMKYFLIQKKVIKNAKFITCVSSNLLNLLSASKNIKFIPHGIDTLYWNISRSDIANKNEKMVICIGYHGLDLNLLKKLIENNLDYDFYLIGENYANFNYTNCYKYTNRISDDELKNLYTKANFMLRPVIFSTANNSILEAMAMGCIIITNNIAGINDYINKQNGIFIENLINYKFNFKKENLEIIRNNSLNSIYNSFSWEKIFKQYEGIYKL